MHLLKICLLLSLCHRSFIDNDRTSSARACVQPSTTAAALLSYDDTRRHYYTGQLHGSDGEDFLFPLLFFSFYHSTHPVGKYLVHRQAQAHLWRWSELQDALDGAFCPFSLPLSSPLHSFYTRTQVTTPPNYWHRSAETATRSLSGEQPVVTASCGAAMLWVGASGTAFCG